MRSWDYDNLKDRGGENHETETVVKEKGNLHFRQWRGRGRAFQSEALSLEGEILHIHQRNSDNTNNVTAQLTLEDQDNFQMWDGTAKAENANYDHEFGVTIRRILSGKNTLKCTISGDPGTSGYIVTAVIYFVGRDG